MWYNEEHKKRALKNFSAFLNECRQSVFFYGTENYKCDHCNGSGRVVSPYAFNDPVEGYKMADRVDCHKCNGTGESDEKIWKEIYKKQRASYLEVKKEKALRDKIRKEALKKLTPEEIKALNIYIEKRK